MSEVCFPIDPGQCQHTRLEGPERVQISQALAEDAIWIAIFTLHCYRVALLGPPRTFREQSAAHAVTHGVYLKGAPPICDGGVKVGGDAGYGPLLMNGEREEGADFNDYLGITWRYPIPPSVGHGDACPKPDKCRELSAQTDERWCLDAPEARQLGCLDCSGYMRMIWGFRHHLPCVAYPSGVPLGLCLDRCGKTLPRRARDMAEGAPGVLVIPNDSERPTAAALKTLQVGDLVFFDRDKQDGTSIDHVGMYLGKDQGGNRRFISSRKTANGPTLGDCGGRSLLNGSGDYAKALRAARRI